MEIYTMQITNTPNVYNRNVSFQKLYIYNTERMTGALPKICANHPELNRIAGKLERVGKDFVLDATSSFGELFVIGFPRKFGEIAKNTYTILARGNNHKQLAESLKNFKCKDLNLYELGLGRPETKNIYAWAEWYRNNL